MLKREYTNKFVTSSNLDTHEVSIVFKQECVELALDPNVDDGDIKTEKGIIDVGAVTMTYENARQLAQLLGDVVVSMEKRNQEHNDGVQD